ncbi:hypothetical protein I551_8538 [Mycobacterium ulcerans str. Harvey]|uniref:Uncharacterized protein n=1 Tax=Mycobacterium ulcerans str. Harvey TaxID=1299332 RepID=A0ABN0RAG5_MYCUL|nr:hypothetical protein I551_8538 [Mycobacterium ulcerans str. Harvey]
MRNSLVAAFSTSSQSSSAATSTASMVAPGWRSSPRRVRRDFVEFRFDAARARRA